MQFLYGEDGMDGTAIESQKLEHLRMTPEKFRVRHLVPPINVHCQRGISPCNVASTALLLILEAGLVSLPVVSKLKVLTGCVQKVFYLDLSPNRPTPNWLDADMAEQLRHSVEARQLLEAEFEQVGAKCHKNSSKLKFSTLHITCFPFRECCSWHSN